LFRRCIERANGSLGPALFVVGPAADGRVERITMTNLSLEGLRIQVPADFVQEEVVASWRVPSAPDLKDPRLMQTQAVVRPNLTVTRVPANGHDLEGVAARSCEELMQRIEGIKGVKASEVVFADGKQGVLLEYAFPVMSFTVVQMQAMRIDDDTLTTLALCTEASRLTDAVHDSYVKSLLSASLGSKQ
jgi:hypothetical protein